MISVKEAIELDNDCKRDLRVLYIEKYNTTIKLVDEMIKRDIRAGYLYKEHIHMMCVSCNEDPDAMKNLLRHISSDYAKNGWYTRIFTENDDQHHIFLGLRIKR